MKDLRMGYISSILFFFILTFGSIQYHHPKNEFLSASIAVAYDSGASITEETLVTPTELASAPSTAAATTTTSGGAASGGSPDAAGAVLDPGLKKLELIIKNIESGFLAGAQPFTDIESAYNKYKASYESCKRNQSIATYACLENLSPHIQAVIPAINMLTSTASASTTKTCSNVKNTMDLVNKALTLFSAACGAGKMACVSGCGSAVTDLKTLQGLVEYKSTAVIQVYNARISASPGNPLNKQLGTGITTITNAQESFKAYSQPESVPGNKVAMAGKLETCSVQYAAILASAGVGIFSTIKSMKDAAKCKDQSDGTGNKCEDPEQANTLVCVCEKNPRLAGCPNSLEKVDPNSLTQKFSTSADGGGGDAKTPAINAPGGLEDPFTNEKGTGSGGDSSLGSLGGAGGNSGSSLGSGQGAEAGTGKKSAEVKLNDGTAGGGGRGVASWGSNFSDPASRAALLKGDPAKAQALASMHQFKKEVTPGEGQSNWEKVKNRYRDNRHTLIGK
ncbi:MAG TPA: hypothetical protein PLJ21_07705 [Pseudobdellovibrionaceae bacterium]|nr:hypothetical protein [Pseudobdellovibrionaceae bacterium]